MEDKKLASALWYLKHGFSVIPTKQDKKPWIKWEQYQKERPTEAQVREWWGDKFKFANIGIVTGSISGLTVLDVDTKAGMDKLNDLLPDSWLTPTVDTPGRGAHFYCKYEPGISNAVRFMDGCDIRSEGGYVIAPPSSDARGAWKWRDGLRIADLPLNNIPGNILKNIHSVYIYSNVTPGVVTPPQCSISFNEGARDDTIFHLANHLVKSGMPENEILQYLEFIAKNCNPPYPLKDIPIKIKSAQTRTVHSEKTVTQEVKEFIEVTKGNFRVTDVQQWVTTVTSKSNKAVLMALSRLVKEGKIERLSSPGTYRVIDATADVINIKDVQKGEWLDLRLPFSLDRFCKIAPGNLILIAGVTNSGKSAIMFDMIRENMKQFRCNYFSSEMNKETVKGRIEKYSGDVDWDFNIVENWNQNVDCLMPDDLNFIDWVEAGVDTWTLATVLSSIQQKMRRGVAIAALQKNRTSDNPFGGEQTLSKSSLALTVDPDYPGAIMRVRKAKAFDEDNPNGFMIRFKIVQGVNLIKDGSWMPEMEDKYKSFKGNKSNRGNNG